jgi:hypothetical protein
MRANLKIGHYIWEKIRTLKGAGCGTHVSGLRKKDGRFGRRGIHSSGPPEGGRYAGI